MEKVTDVLAGGTMSWQLKLAKVVAKKSHG
jgi:hypothetical protein